ncbi:MAG TPA: hypothetical protein ENI23_04795 [bacterium]|nr:hypothetical protein [bacterium]
MPFQKGNKINSGKKYTGKHRENISNGRKGIKFTDEHIENLRNSHKGQKPWNKGLTKKTDKRIFKYSQKVSESTIGRKLPEEHKKKIKENHSRYWFGKQRLDMIGSKNPSWQGGISFEPYSSDWTETLKKSIRQRDNYICQLSGKYGNCVHHIDYDKENCSPTNLITLSVSSHSKVNFNREYWTNYFNNKLNIKQYATQIKTTSS